MGSQDQCTVVHEASFLRDEGGRCVLRVEQLNDLFKHGLPYLSITITAIRTLTRCSAVFALAKTRAVFFSATIAFARATRHHTPGSFTFGVSFRRHMIITIRASAMDRARQTGSVALTIKLQASALRALAGHALVGAARRRQPKKMQMIFATLFFSLRYKEGGEMDSKQKNDSTTSLESMCDSTDFEEDASSSIQFEKRKIGRAHTFHSLHIPKRQTSIIPTSASADDILVSDFVAVHPLLKWIFG